LQFGPLGGEEGFALEFGGQGLIFGRHMAQCDRGRRQRGPADCSSGAGGLFGGLPAYRRCGGPTSGLGGASPGEAPLSARTDEGMGGRRYSYGS
jgi:hypothetical protein